ncbi:pentapeptide repeat-containing protein [Vibrio splendidus]
MEVKSREHFIELWNGGQRNFSNYRFENNMDLSNLNMDKLIARNATMSGVDITGSSLNGAKIKGAFIYNSVWRDTEANNIDISECCISNSIIEYSEFRNANCTKTNFKFVDLEQLKLCDFEGAKIRGSELDFFKVNSNNISLGVLAGTMILVIGMAIGCF